MEELVLTLPKFVVILPDLREGVFVGVFKLDGDPICIFTAKGGVMIGGMATGYQQLPRTSAELHAAMSNLVA